MPRPSSLNDVLLFIEVARTGSFSRAAINLEIPGATLSRRISTLEQELGIRLFDRTTRRIVLTEAARRYFERCAPLVDELRIADDSLRDETKHPKGHLRLSAPVDFAIHWLAPLMPEFARQHPAISFDIDLSPQNSDLLSGRTDLAIRLGSVNDDHLIARRIGVIHMALFAAPDYLVRHGRPTHPLDLVDHDCLHVLPSKQPIRWRLTDRQLKTTEVVVRGRFGLNNMSLMRYLTKQGMGIAILPIRMALENVAAGTLEAVLPDYELPSMPVNIILSSRLQPSSTRTFIDFVATQLDAK